MKSNLSLSIAAPAFNEAAGIREVICKWYHYLKKQNDITQFEIVICNDGSEDNTGAILDELAKEYPEVKPLHFKRNQGAAVALAAAIQATQLDWVLLTDSDNQFPIDNLSIMLAKLHGTDANAIIGIRRKKDHFFARVGSKASGFICNKVHGTNIRDFNSAFKLIKGSLLRSFKLETKGMNCSTEMTSRLAESKIPMLEVDIEHQARETGKSSLKWPQDAIHRFLFVCYIALRQLLIKMGTLRRPYE